MSEQQTLDAFARQVAQILKRLLGKGKASDKPTEAKEEEGGER